MRQEALSKIADMAVGYIDEEEAHEPRRAVADFDRPKTSQSHYVGVFSNPNVEIAHSGATGVIGEALVRTGSTKLNLWAVLLLH